MVSINLNIEDSVYDKVMYLLKLFPKKDVKIIQERVIEEIDPTILPKDDFDYMSREYLEEIDRSIKKAKEEGLQNLKSYEELRNEL